MPAYAVKLLQHPYLVKTVAYAKGHLVTSSFIGIALLGVLWFSYTHFTSATNQTSYVLGTVTKGTIVASISASGQVSASDQLDVKPKASGEIWWVGVKPGDTVYAGQALLSIDNTDAKQAVVNAEQSLAAAKLQYQKDSAQAPISYQQALDTLQNAKDDLAATYTDTYNTLSDTYLGLPAVMAGADSTLNGFDLSPYATQSNVDILINLFGYDKLSYLQGFGDRANTDYAAARKKYDASVLAYKDLTRYSSTDTLEALLIQSIDTVTAITQALQSELNLLSTVTDVAQQQNKKLSSGVTALQTNARSYLSTANSDLSSLLAQKKLIDAGKQSITADTQNITLLQVGNQTGSNPISLQISKNNLDQQEQNLQKLRQDLADYTVVAPFSGTIAAVNVKPHDTASTGTTAVTLITNQKVAELSLNEVDAAKIALGDKATITFDAIDSLSLTGTVAEIDTVGTVSQGVVSYTVKIAFDAQDVRVKPGMTANAAIITAVHQEVLTVPSSAVKTQGGVSYVLVFNPPLSITGETSQGVISATAPQQVPVEVGITDDAYVEITSGLTEGAQIVVRTVTGAQAAAATTPTAARSGTFGGLGGGTRTFQVGR